MAPLNIALCPPGAPMLGFGGAAIALVFSCIGSAWGTGRAGMGISQIGTQKPEVRPRERRRRRRRRDEFVLLRDGRVEARGAIGTRGARDEVGAVSRNGRRRTIMDGGDRVGGVAGRVGLVARAPSRG